MDQQKFLRLLPTMQMMAEVLPGAVLWTREPALSYRGVRLYRGQQPLETDIVYLLRPEDTGTFPLDTYSWVSTIPASGSANHIVCPEFSMEEILEQLLSLFARCQAGETELDDLVYQEGSLQELCELGARLMDNPVYIHDDWFMMLARSAQVDQVMPPEYMMSSAAGFVPRVIVEDFKYDSDYLETYSYRTAQIWESGPGIPRCMYVNLWEGKVYRGRLLVIETNHPFRAGDGLVAQVLTQRALFLLRRKPLGETQQQSMDNAVFRLLQGVLPEPADLSQLLGTLGWNREDQFVCLRIQSQQANATPLMEHLVHSDLFQHFPDAYILLAGHQQRVILNLSQQDTTLPEIHYRLAPLCRDYCLYAGISSPVTGIRDLHLADYQAGEALNRAFQLRSEKWILAFSDCALDYMMNSLREPLNASHLVSPELLYLMRYDREKGTDYYATLREYLFQERDIPRTAEKLIIHRTTLLYRLKKLKRMVPLNLEDPKQRLYLLLSLWILEQGRE